MMGPSDGEVATSSNEIFKDLKLLCIPILLLGGVLWENLKHIRQEITNRLWGYMSKAGKIVFLILLALFILTYKE